MSIKRILFCPDVHSPFEDKQAWNLFVKIGRAFKPDIMVVLGDFVDCYSVSRHSKDPARKLHLITECQEASKLLDQLDDVAGTAEKKFFRGNHEYRTDRYIADKAPELYGMVDVGQLLGLKERGWEDIPYLKGQRIGSVYVTHDTGFAGPRAHVQSRDLVGRGIVIGHTHRMALEYRESVGRRGVAPAAMMGTLASRPSIEYVHEAKTHLWTLGCGVGLVTASGAMHLNMVPFYPVGQSGLEAMVFGELFRG